MVILLPDLQALASAPIFASIIVHPSPAARVIFQRVSVQTLVLRQVSTSKHNRLLHGQDIFGASSCLSSFNSACHVPHCYPSLISGLAAPTTLQAHASLGASVLLFLLCVWLLQPMSGGFSVTSSDRLVREDLTKTPAHHSLSILFLFIFLQQSSWSYCLVSHSSSTQAGVCLVPYPNLGAQPGV